MNQLYCRNYKTSEIIDDFMIHSYNQHICIPFHQNYDYNIQHYIVMKYHDPIMQKVLEKTGCMIFGNYMIYENKHISYLQKDKTNSSMRYSISTEDVIAELSKYYVGQENRLEEFLS